MPNDFNPLLSPSEISNIQNQFNLPNSSRPNQFQSSSENSYCRGNLVTPIRMLNPYFPVDDHNLFLRSRNCNLPLSPPSNISINENRIDSGSRNILPQLSLTNQINVGSTQTIGQKKRQKKRSSESNLASGQASSNVVLQQHNMSASAHSTTKLRRLNDPLTPPSYPENQPAEFHLPLPALSLFSPTRDIFASIDSDFSTALANSSISPINACTSQEQQLPVSTNYLNVVNSAQSSQSSNFTVSETAAQGQVNIFFQVIC